VTEAAGRAAGWRRRLPSRALGVFLVLILTTFLASRTCGSTSGLLDKDEATAIAKREIDYPIDGTNVRFVRRGVSQHPYWAVSLWQRGAGGAGYRRITVVVVDAESGRVAQVDLNRTTP
jgi:hypothetical protein